MKDVIRPNLLKTRKALGLTQEEMAKKIAMPLSSYRKWETGIHAIGMENIIKISKALHVPIDVLVYEGADIPTVSSGYIDVPLYGSIAAGEPIEMIPTDDSHSIPVAVHKKYPNAFLLEVKGESMNRVLPNGSYALIDPCVNVDSDGKPYAVCVNGYDATIKRVRRLENGFELVPDSTDPTFHAEVFDYSIEGTKTITIIGRVVWYTVPYDWSF